MCVGHCSRFAASATTEKAWVRFNFWLILCPMNLRQIEAFRAVMTAGTVRGAAELLRVSEPAVSKLLSTAERRTGLRLFDRSKGRLVPTPEAHALHREVDFLWRRVERVRDTVQALSNPSAAGLSLSVSPSLAQLVPP